MTTLSRAQIRSQSAWRKQHNRVGYLYVLPALVFFLLMTAWPIARSFYLSFHDYYLLEPEATRFVGFGNYAKLFTESVNHQPLWNTLRFTVMFVPPYVVLALVIAVMLHAVKRGSTVLRTMIFTPVVVSMAVSAVLWAMFYDKTYGMGHWLLGPLGPKEGILGNAHWAMGGIVLMCIWNGIAVNTILFLVGLERISDDVYESALVDGATAWQRFWHVTLPQLRGTIVLVVVLSLIGALKVFGQPYIMTGGGPADSTQTFVMRLYELAFRTRSFELGYASALAYSLAALIFVFSVVVWRFNKPVE